MSNVYANLLGKISGRFGKQGAGAPVDRAYVSEFTGFIDQFLKEHPEVVKDQWVGREIYWDKQVDFADQAKATKDSVPEDGYGFYYSAWLDQKKRSPSPLKSEDAAQKH